MRRLTRREALALGAGSLLTAGCGSSGSSASRTGSTLASTWHDPAGTGSLRPGPGERLLARTELGPIRPARRVLATLAHVTDAHVLDASSPARVPFLDRLGEPFESTFRPQEALTAQVLAGAAQAIAALRADAVIQGGDLIDNDQRNELAWALRILRGGVVRPGSGPHGYPGVQLAGDPDPFYYRPDVGPHLRLIVLDLARRGGGSGGLVRPDQPGWLARQLRDAGERWVIVVSHQPLASSEGGEPLLSLLDAHPRVIAALAGHTHRNSIEPRGHCWLINTASLIDYPQQARALRVVATAGGGVAIQTWMLDHTGGLGTISRELAYLDA